MTLDGKGKTQLPPLLSGATRPGANRVFGAKRGSRGCAMLCRFSSRTWGNEVTTPARMVRVRLCCVPKVFGAKKIMKKNNSHCACHCACHTSCRLRVELFSLTLTFLAPKTRRNVGPSTAIRRFNEFRARCESYVIGRATERAPGR